MHSSDALLKLLVIWGKVRARYQRKQPGMFCLKYVQQGNGERFQKVSKMRGEVFNSTLHNSVEIRVSAFRVFKAVRSDGSGSQIVATFRELKQLEAR